MGSDAQLFSQLFVDHHSKFVRFANNYVRSLTIAEDFASDAMIRYWENRHRLSQDTNVLAYILTTLKNKCLNHLEHMKVREKVSADILTNAQWDLNTRIATLQALEPTELYTKEINDMVNKALLKLPEKTQLIFRKSQSENMSNKEIAKEFGISVKTVEAHITSARKLLRSELGDYLTMFLFLLL